jgi:hypothetical protein
VEPAFTEAMPNDNIGLHTFVMTAWLHYLGGVSVNYIVDLLNKLFRFKISPGGLTQGWLRLARLLKSEYDRLGEEARNSAVLHADETGWRQSGDLRWLWKKANLYFRLQWLVKQDYSDKDCQRLRNRLERYREELFTFLERDDAPTTITQSSRCAS